MSGMTQPPSTVHHLVRTSEDLLPFCGAWPGKDDKTGDWHCCHDLDTLLLALEHGVLCCAVCLSPRALGGWTPLIFDEVEVDGPIEEVFDDGDEPWCG